MMHIITYIVIYYIVMARPAAWRVLVDMARLLGVCMLIEITRLLGVCLLIYGTATWHVLVRDCTAT